MQNRIFLRSAITDYISFRCQVTYITFSGLEEKTRQRLLNLGYSPPMQFRGGLKNSEPVQAGDTVCPLLLPKIVHLGNLEDWLAKNQ